MLAGGPGDGASEGLRLHCSGAGGDAVYLVGGGPAFSTWHLAPVQQALADRYRVCRWDMRGVGDHRDLPLPQGGTLLEAWLGDMARVLPAEPVTLWGHSWGALQALKFAAAHPGRVAGLVLSNPVDPALDSLEGIEERRYHHPLPPEARPRLEDMGTSRERLLALRRKMASYFPDAVTGWAYARRFERSDADGALNVRVWGEYRARPLGPGDLERLAPKVAGAIYCRDDVLMPENLNAYRRLLPATRHVVLEECGHFPWADAPGRYRKVLREMVRMARGSG